MFFFLCSYDYDCLISESGLLTSKWHQTRLLLANFGLLPKNTPTAVENSHPKSYGTPNEVGWIPLSELLENCPRVQAEVPQTMEQLTYKNGFGQSYGFVAYEKSIPNAAGELCIEEVHDRAIILVNGQQQALIEYTVSAGRNHKVQVILSELFTLMMR